MANLFSLLKDLSISPTISVSILFITLIFLVLLLHQYRPTVRAFSGKRATTGMDRHLPFLHKTGSKNKGADCVLADGIFTNAVFTEAVFTGGADTSLWSSKYKKIFDDMYFDHFVKETIRGEIPTHLIPSPSDPNINEAKFIGLSELRKFVFHALCSIAMGTIPARLESDQKSLAKTVEKADATNQKEIGEALDKYVYKIIDHRIEEILNGGGRNKQDFLSRIVMSEIEEKGEGHLVAIYSGNSKESEKMVETNKFRDTIMGFLAAGTDTISYALNCFFQRLKENTECQKILANDVRGMENFRNQYLLSRLDYVHACVMETLRLDPPVLQPPDEKSNAKAAQVQLREETEQEKQEREDRKKFKPERWLDERRVFVGADKYWLEHSGYFMAKCSGKEIVCSLMKSVAAVVLSHLEVSGEAERSLLTKRPLSDKKPN